MRDALRRVLWLVPTLVVLTLAAFLLLARTMGPEAAVPRWEGLPRERMAALSPFFERSPRGVAERSRAALEAVARNDASSAGGAAELVRLGAAALPTVVPAFDSLPPEGRSRVAIALAPLAERMGVARADDLRDGTAAVLFWTRYWQDHGVDFRLASIRRAVRRWVEHPSPTREREIRELDTYALGAVIEALGAPGDSTDLVERTRRLSALASGATGVPWVIPDAASPGEAASVASRWRAYWTLVGDDFTPLQGWERVAAMIGETQYGTWARLTIDGTLGTLRDGRSARDVLFASVPVTLLLVLCGLVGGGAAGALLSVRAAASSRIDRPSIVCAVAVAALPAVLAARLWGPGPGRLALGGALVAISGAAAWAAHARTLLRPVLARDFVRGHLALGASRPRAAAWALRASAGPLLARATIELPSIATATFAVEAVLGLPGLGAVTLSAVRDRELSWVMGIALLSAGAVALTQIVTDFALLRLDPRARRTWSLRRGGLA